MNDTQLYNDFMEDYKIPIKDRYKCQSCEQLVPIANSVHTCHCAKQSRGEDISDCNCAIHGAIKERAEQTMVLKGALADKKVSTQDVQLSTDGGQPIGTLHFYDEFKMNIAVKSMDWALAMWNLDNDMRSRIKYAEKDSEFLDGVQWARDKMLEIMNERGISLEDIE